MIHPSSSSRAESQEPFDYFPRSCQNSKRDFTVHPTLENSLKIERYYVKNNLLLSFDTSWTGNFNVVNVFTSVLYRIKKFQRKNWHSLMDHGQIPVLLSSVVVIFLYTQVKFTTLVHCQHLAASTSRPFSGYTNSSRSCNNSATMPPREATGAFPDQYLTFDYDSSAGLGIQPPPPAITGTTADLQPQPVEGTIVEGSGLHAQPSTNPTRGSTATQHVDPLSIDPTLHQSATWSPAVGSSTSPDTTALVSFPYANQTSTGLTAISSNSNDGLAGVTQCADEVTPNRLIRNHAGNGGIHTASAISASSPPSSQASSSLRFNGSSFPLGTPLSASANRLRLRPYQGETIGSVLDNSTSMESDDEDDIPILEQTVDSTVSDGEKMVDTTEVAGVVTDEETGSDSSSCGASSQSIQSLGLIQRNSAFDLANDTPASPEPSSSTPCNATNPPSSTAPMSPTSILLSFGPNTSVSDLKYFAERGCIVALLHALTNPRLITLGTRMLADYAKMSDRRVAVASNRRILEFVQKTMLQVSEQADWLGREYAVETVRSLTATEESDRYLMSAPGLLNTLALVARGGPFVTHVQENGVRTTVPLASEKARLHACIAVMNLSCGKANKIEIAKIPDVLEAMRDVMINSNNEARLKATTCVKNLSNADANDTALLGTPGLVEALGHVAAATCSPETGATTCTTNACLALMNLSISKTNKHRVFRTPGVMEALMVVLERTTAQGSSNEARIKACSALSNLAIGYDNKIPMFAYKGFVDAILNVIQTDTGEARTKACSILWSFAAEMKNQVPVSWWKCMCDSFPPFE